MERSMNKNVWFAVALSWVVGVLSAPPLFGDAADGVRIKAMAVLKSDAPLEQKSAACEDLARVGDKDCVPVLAGMLGNEQLSHRARYALEAIPDRSVDEALRAALGTLSGKLLSGVISSIGARRDAAAVELLGKKLDDRDGDVVRATATALGRIGTVAASKAMLDAVKDAKGDNIGRICDGLLTCGANLAAQGQQGEAKKIYDGLLAQDLPARFRAAALRGAVLCDRSGGMKLLRTMLHDNEFGVFAMALRVSAGMKEKDVTDVLVSEVGKLAADRVIPVVRILGQRGDKVALPLLLEMANNGEKDVRLEAIQSVGEMGDASAVPVLVVLMQDKNEAIGRAAATAVAGLPGLEVDAAIVKALESPVPALRLKMIEVAGQRRVASAMPVLLRTMSDKDMSVRTAAARSYIEMAGAGGIPVLIEMLTKSTDGAEIGLYEGLLGSVCPMAGDKDPCAPRLVAALAQAGPAVKPALLRTLRVAGGPDALKAVRGALDDPNKEVHTAALRALSEWTSAEAAPALLELAKNSGEPTERLVALRGYLGIALQKSVAVQDKLSICRQAAPITQRVEEKRMLLGALGSGADAESLDLIVPYLDDAAVKREAVATLMAIAEKRKPKEYADVAKAALEKVVKVAADDPAVVKRAEELLKQMGSEK
jgi:HEAT repeat protein